MYGNLELSRRPEETQNNELPLHVDYGPVCALKRRQCSDSAGPSVMVAQTSYVSKHVSVEWGGKNKTRFCSHLTGLTWAVLVIVGLN